MKKKSIEFLCKSYPDLAVQARIPELLQAQRADMDRQAAEARAAAGIDEDDDDMDDEEETRLILNGARRGGVSSGSLNSENVPAGSPKTDEQKDRIFDTINQNGFLRQLDESVQDLLVNSLVSRQVNTGEAIITEGAAVEEANEFFIIEEGMVEMKQRNSPNTRIMSAGESFGELSLLHGSKREASYVAASPCTLWVLGRDAYRATIMRATEARRTRYKDFLRQVIVT
jgi:hypothetical protein